MDPNQTQATAVDVGQVQQNTPPDQQQSQQQTQAAPDTHQAQATAQQQQSPTPEEIAQWRSAAEKSAQLETNYKELQGAYTRSQQALKVITGQQIQQPQQDPLAPFIAQYQQQGLDEQSARYAAQIRYDAQQPILQEINNLRSMFQAQSVIPQVMEEASLKNRSVFADPEVQQAVRNNLQAAINAGYHNLVTAESALDWAYQEAGRRHFMQQAPATQQQQQQRQVAPMNFGPMNGVVSNFNGVQAPMQQNGNQVPAHIKQMQDEVRKSVEARHNLPNLSQQQ